MAQLDIVHDRGPVIPLQRQLCLRVSGNFVPKRDFSGYRWRNTEIFVERDHVPPAEGAASFHTTRWTIVMRAAQSQAPAGESASPRLCRNDWYPFYMFVRRPAEIDEKTRALCEALIASGGRLRR
jgi:hypothetical protein